MRVTSLGVAALITVLLLAVAGCGGGDGDGGSKTSSSAKSNTVLRVGTTDSIPSFDPFGPGVTPESGTAMAMVYPTLVQLDYSDKEWKVAPDLATSWTVSPNGKRVTFKLHDNAKWSDGKPITASDAAWTINTIVKFQDDVTGMAASNVAAITKATAVDPTTLTIDYSRVQSNRLDLLADRLPMLPEHVFAPKAVGNGRALRTFQPEREPGGLVSGGPYLLKKFDEHGTTVFVRNPSFYGDASKAAAVAVTSYTNADVMVQAYREGQLDFIESVPTTAIDAVRKTPDTALTISASAMQADLFTNANPRKPTNRELLDPRVKLAIAMCIDREQIINVVFNGNAKMLETPLGNLSGFANRTLGPRPHDCASANASLDKLGYKKGPDGIRVVPATTGTYAQPAHKMSYGIVTSNSAPFNLDRTSTILRANLKQLGVDVTQNVVGDETATWTKIMGSSCDAEKRKGYTGWDFWVDIDVSDPDPLVTLRHFTSYSLCAWNLAGYDDASYDAIYDKAISELDEGTLREQIMAMQKNYFDAGVELPLAEMVIATAHSSKWDGFVAPQLANGYNKNWFTAPHPVD